MAVGLDGLNYAPARQRMKLFILCINMWLNTQRREGKAEENNGKNS